MSVDNDARTTPATPVAGVVHVFDRLRVSDWAVVYDVDPEQQQELRAYVRSTARQLNWRVRTFFHAATRSLTIIRDRRDTPMAISGALPGVCDVAL